MRFHGSLGWFPAAQQRSLGATLPGERLDAANGDRIIELLELLVTSFRNLPYPVVDLSPLLMKGHL